jgi:hypothetical protein
MLFSLPSPSTNKASTGSLLGSIKYSKLPNKPQIITIEIKDKLLLAITVATKIGTEIINPNPKPNINMIVR